jgi:hypothetical protein
VVLGSDIDPARRKWTIEVPDVRPGPGYRLAVSNDDPLTVHSQDITITEPA